MIGVSSSGISGVSGLSVFTSLIFLALAVPLSSQTLIFFEVSPAGIWNLTEMASHSFVFVFSAKDLSVLSVPGFFWAMEMAFAVSAYTSPLNSYQAPGSRPFTSRLIPLASLPASNAL